jgi:hypothetical protein
MYYEIINYRTGCWGGLLAVAVIQVSQFVSSHHGEILTPSRQHELQILPRCKRR